MTGRLAIAAATLLMLGCSSAVPPTPTPTTTPGDTASPTSTPTIASTATPLAYPTGDTEVVLRMTVFGWPFPFTVLSPPQFSLYGDGRAIYTVERRTGDGPARTIELRSAQLSNDQVGQLLTYALGPGGLSQARDRYDDPTIYDAGTTVFEIHAGGLDKTVWVYALGLHDHPLPDAEDRAKFELLAGKLALFADDVTSGTYADLGEWVPEWYDAYLSPLSQGRVNADWPWPGLDPEAFERQPDGTLKHVLSPDQVNAVVALNIDMSLYARGADGILYFIQMRPLLPGQLGNM